MDKKRKTTTFLLVGLVLFMLGLAFASVPLYRIFCQKTGYGGTPQISAVFPKRISKKKITIRFTSQVSKDLPWAFIPLQKEITVQAGQKAFALYHVKNTSSKPLVGMATYNVTPDKAGPYFNKVECFCFLEQRLAPHQSLDMPLLFFIDPDIDQDPNLEGVEEITLSYTFFPFTGDIPEEPYGRKTPSIL